MRYSYEYKRKCIERYRQGIWPDAPVDVNIKSFHNMVMEWVRMEDIHGPDALKHILILKYN